MDGSIKAATPEPERTAPSATAASALVDRQDAPVPTDGETTAPLDPEAEARARAEEAAAKEAAEREAQLQRLMQRMQSHADFPSLKDSIRGIQAVSRSETAHLRTLTDEVLGDVALSNKLLRMINTAFYSSVGGGNISSLSRAVALMGFQPIGMLATSLTLFDRLPKGPDGARVRKEFGRALMAAMLANQFCPVRRLEESAYITAMFQNLGTMLAWMHFPPEAAQIETAWHGGETQDHDTLQTAARQVLGMGYDDMAVEVARQWGWPEGMQVNLRRLEPSDPEQHATKDEYLRVVCTAANHLAVELESVSTPEELEICLAHFSQRYAVAMGLNEEDLPGMVETARTQWSDLALVLGFSKIESQVKAEAAAQEKIRAKELAKQQARQGGAQAARPGDRDAPGAAPRKPVAAPVLRADPAVAAALTHALDTLSKRALSDAPLSEVMNLVMKQVHEALQLQRVLICLRSANGAELTGRLGVGFRADRLVPHFKVPLQPPADLFGLLCTKEADTLISDTTDPVIAQRLPLWFKQQVQAPCFVMLPLAMNGKLLGMIYGDKGDPNSLQISDSELTLLKALRNQLIIAMRLRGVSG